MIRSFFLISCIYITMAADCLCGRDTNDNPYCTPIIFGSDTLVTDQVLYNGRIWQNLYSQVQGDQFLFSKEFLYGTVTIRGRTFSGIRIMYDIFRDEILIPYKPVGILQLNKEMIDSFSIFFNNKKYLFKRISPSTDKRESYFLNEVYNGRTKLFARYEKKIEKLADGGKYDEFYQVTRVFITNRGVSHIVTGKKDLYRLFYEDKKPIKKYIKDNKLRITRDDAETFIPVLKFIDSR